MYGVLFSKEREGNTMNSFCYFDVLRKKNLLNLLFNDINQYAKDERKSLGSENERWEEV